MIHSDFNLSEVAYLQPDATTLLAKRFGIVSEMFQNLTPMYSTADIAKRLGCTAQAVNKYRRKIEKRDGKQLGQPDPTDGRRTLFF
jgi:transposase-like protein